MMEGQYPECRRGDVWIVRGYFGGYEYLEVGLSVLIIICYQKIIEIDFKGEQMLQILTLLICIDIFSMINNKRKQKMMIDKGFQEDIREVKTLLTQGKTMLDRASSELDFTEALQVFNKAILKISSIQVANTYLLYYYRGLCYMNLKQYVKAERDFVEGLGITDDKGKVQLFNSLGKCKTEMSIEDPSYIDEAIKYYEKACVASKNQDPQAYLSLGNIYKQLKNNSQAVTEYTNALKYLKAPGILHSVYSSRGVCYREIGEIQKSTKDFLAACELRKDDSETYFNLGINNMLTEDYEKALENFDLAIDMDPSKPFYLNCKALTLYHLEQFQSSLCIFKEAIHIFQNKERNTNKMSETLYNMGNCLLKMGKNEDALKTFQMSLDLCDSEELRLKINYSVGLTSEQLQKLESAIDKFEETLRSISEKKYHSLYLSTLYHLGMNYYKKKQYRLAIEQFQRIIELQSNEKCVYLIRGKTYLEAELYAEALADFQMMLTLDENDPVAYFYIGKTKTCLGQIDSAIADFFKAIGLGSRESQIIDGIAGAYLKAGKPDKALVYSNIALSRNSNNQQFLVHRSMIYIQLEQYLKAIQDLTNAHKLSKQNPFIYYQRGISYYRSKQFDKAIQDLKKSLQLHPTARIQADIHYLIGISYANLQEYQQAIAPLTEAITYKQLPKYYHERAKCYLILDQSEKALQDLNEVIDRQPDNAFAYFRRGLAYKALKKYEDAADSFMKARDIEPDDPRLVLNKKKIYEIKYRKLCEPGQEK